MGPWRLADRLQGTHPETRPSGSRKRTTTLTPFPEPSGAHPVGFLSAFVLPFLKRVGQHSFGTGRASCDLSSHLTLGFT